MAWDTQKDRQVHHNSSFWPQKYVLLKKWGCQWGFFCYFVCFPRVLQGVSEGWRVLLMRNIVNCLLRNNQLMLPLNILLAVLINAPPISYILTAIWNITKTSASNKYWSQQEFAIAIITQVKTITATSSQLKNQSIFHLISFASDANNCQHLNAFILLLVPVLNCCLFPQINAILLLLYLWGCGVGLRGGVFLVFGLVLLNLRTALSSICRGEDTEEKYPRDKYPNFVLSFLFVFFFNFFFI